jgi:hypothetical protein
MTRRQNAGFLLLGDGRNGPTHARGHREVAYGTLICPVVSPCSGITFEVKLTEKGLFLLLPEEQKTNRQKQAMKGKMYMC